MLTHAEMTRFQREWAKLTPSQKTALLTSVDEMVDGLRANRLFRPSLRVKNVKSHPGIMEMT